MLHFVSYELNPSNNKNSNFKYPIRTLDSILSKLVKFASFDNLIQFQLFSIGTNNSKKVK
jgi:hypothetical protein